ncbi:hypothetical protein CRENPOLYSF2_1150017 [Crenothrix polyspora]|uniref:Uncharacterized protein n=1 Tax=Crenothrix polyspora TaxID=360316 RepID=A0A1R4GZG0_9GAMM|nr:hypothetical protein CRENPOLYSF2_1150017 [Crenothrix polyspora]
MLITRKNCNYSVDVKKVHGKHKKHGKVCGYFVVKKIITENLLCFLCFPWIDKNVVPYFWRTE